MSDKQQLKSIRNSLIDLFLQIKVRSNDEIEKYSESDLGQERQKLKETESETIINYIKTTIEVLMNMKKEDDQQSESSLASKVSKDIPKDYEKQLVKYEEEIRSHIKCEQQLKLHLECTQDTVDELTAENSGYKRALEKLEQDLEDQCFKYEEKLRVKEEEIEEMKREMVKEKEAFINEVEQLRKKQKPTIKDALESFTYSGIDSKTTDNSGKRHQSSSRHSVKVPQDQQLSKLKDQYSRILIQEIEKLRSSHNNSEVNNTMDSQRVKSQIKRQHAKMASIISNSQRSSPQPSWQKDLLKMKKNYQTSAQSIQKKIKAQTFKHSRHAGPVGGYATNAALSIYDHGKERGHIVVSSKQVSKRISHSHNTSMSKQQDKTIGGLNRPVVAATQGGVSSHSFCDQVHLRGASYDFGKDDNSSYHPAVKKYKQTTSMEMSRPKTCSPQSTKKTYKSVTKQHI